jgi:serine-type D-Ala-D-Ala carboxypeptidase (penicillin-binding protein 5/6)
MRSVPATGLVGAAVAVLVAAVGAAPATAAASAAKPSPRATTTRSTGAPGMGAASPCATSVTYAINGKAVTPRPLPGPASRVGGQHLAESGLQVTPSASTRPPAPKATAWLVADLDTGQVLAACNAHVPLAPASALKVLTALALSPKVAGGQRYTARDEDARVDGTRVGLVPGSLYTGDDLWHALLMSSANDAAVALGQLAGGLPAATDTMRSTAQRLGAADTVPYNTSGLDLPGQVSSAYDLSLFGRAALADPRLAALMRTRVYAFPEAGTVPPGVRAAGAKAARKTFQIQNHNRLLSNYPGALGVKNGWTSTTGGSFVGAAQRGGRRLVATVLAADPETWHMSAALLDWGFAATTRDAQGVGRLVDGPDPDGEIAGSSSLGSSPPAAGASSGPAGVALPAGRAATQAGAGFPPGVVAAVGGIAVLLVVGAAATTLSSRRRLRG